jgi:hypothetical protein
MNEFQVPLFMRWARNTDIDLIGLRAVNASTDLIIADHMHGAFSAPTPATMSWSDANVFPLLPFLLGGQTAETAVDGALINESQTCQLRLVHEESVNQFGLNDEQAEYVQ